MSLRLTQGSPGLGVPDPRYTFKRGRVWYDSSGAKVDQKGEMGDERPGSDPKRIFMCSLLSRQSH